jgi:hypothetical protein
MQIEVSELTVKRIAQRVRERGLPGLSESDLVVSILNAMANSSDELTFAAIIEEVRKTPAETVLESAREMAERLGLVGAFESGVTDLSTNPVHMSGFGE